MNKAPDSLIDFISSVLSPPVDDINPALEQYVTRPGAVYLSGMYTMNVVNGPFGVPYWMQGIAIQNTNNQYITAPAPAIKSSITHPVYTLYTAGQAPFGQAPTRGVFTGVEDKCT